MLVSSDRKWDPRIGERGEISPLSPLLAAPLLNNVGIKSLLITNSIALITSALTKGKLIAITLLQSKKWFCAFVEVAKLVNASQIRYQRDTG